MTSRERVQAALNFQPVDRVPADINVTAAAHEKLQALLGVCLDDHPKPSLSMEVTPHPDLLNALGVDCLSVKLGAREQMAGPLPERVRDAWGVEYALVQQRMGATYEAVGHPLRDADLEDLEDYLWPDRDPGKKAELLRRHAQSCREETDLALVGRFGGPILEIASNLLGLETWLVRLMTDPEFARALLDRIEDICTAHDLAGIEAAGEWLSIMKVSGEDLGTQQSLMYPPHVFHERLLPVLKRRWDAVRRKLREVRSPAKIMLHSCGAIRPVIPDLIDAGIQVLDPLQPLATGMAADELYAQFGGVLIFHGGIDVQQLLPHASPEAVGIETERIIRALHGRDGGTIVAPSHTVQADVPPENIVAMMEAICL